MLHRQVVEEAVENHLCEQELVAAGDANVFTIIHHIHHPRMTGGGGSRLPADFTGHPSFHLNNIRGAGEPQAPQNSLPALQLVHLQDGLSLL